MTDGRFTSETGRKAGRASARRKLTVERVEQDDVLPIRTLLYDGRLLVLLGHEDAYIAPVGEAFQDGPVGQHIQLLDDLPMHIRGAGRPQHIHAPGALDVGVDDLAGQGQAAEQPAEFSGAAGVLPLLLDHMLLECDYVRHGVLF